eukprot:scaffold65396_cov73-Phaeocystis_antarctica.AAC.4
MQLEMHIAHSDALDVRAVPDEGCAPHATPRGRLKQVRHVTAVRPCAFLLPEVHRHVVAPAAPQAAGDTLVHRTTGRLFLQDCARQLPTADVPSEAVTHA